MELLFYISYVQYLLVITNRKRVREKEGSSGSPSSHGTNVLPGACHALGCNEQPRWLGRGVLSPESEGPATRRKACRAHPRLSGLGTGCEGNV